MHTKSFLLLLLLFLHGATKPIGNISHAVAIFNTGLLTTIIIATCAAYTTQRCLDKVYTPIKKHPGNNEVMRIAYNAALARKKNNVVYRVGLPLFFLGGTLSLLTSLLYAGVI